MDFTELSLTMTDGNQEVAQHVKIAIDIVWRTFVISILYSINWALWWNYSLILGMFTLYVLYTQLTSLYTAVRQLQGANIDAAQRELSVVRSLTTTKLYGGIHKIIVQVSTFRTNALD